MMKYFRGLVAGSFLSAIFSGASFADTVLLPDARFISSIQIDGFPGTYGTTPGIFAQSHCFVGHNCPSSQVDMTVTDLSVKVVGSGGQDSIQSSGQFLYYYEVTGPLPNGLIPLVAEGIEYANANGNGDVSASVTMADFYGNHDQQVCYPVVRCQSGADARTFQQALYAQTNTAYLIGIRVFGEMVPSAGVSGNFSGYADPVLTIDPTWATTHPGYSIALSPNLVPAVPEPTTALLVLVGLGGIATRLWFRMNAPKTQSGSWGPV